MLAEARLPGGTAMAGLSYVDFESHRALVMLGHVNNQPVLVFIDRVQAADQYLTTASDLQASSASPLKTHRQDVGGLMLLEVSPLDQPMFLPAIYPSEDGD